MSRLYTVNKWNRKKLLDKNIFDAGGPVAGAGSAGAAGATTGGAGGEGGTGDGSSTDGMQKPKKNYFAFLAGIPETSFKLGKTNYKRGIWDAADPLYQLAGNKESAVGNAFSDAGVGMFKSAAQSGNAWGMLAGGITKGIGSIINAAIGLEEDKGLKAGVDAGINYNNRFMSTAGSYDDLVGPNAVVDNSNVYKGGWFVKGKARRKNADLALNVAQGKQRAAVSIANNMYNIADDQLLNGLRGYFAYGGPFDPTYNSSDIGAVGYNLASNLLNIKKEQTENKGNGGVPTYFAEGGKIHINPKNKGKFNATKKRTSKTTEELTHSKNPLTRKRAIFAQNAKKWRHDFGGYLNNDNLFAEGGNQNINKEDLAKENLENLVWYLGQKVKYPNGRKRTSFEKFLNNDLGISEKYTEPWFGETPTQNILFNNPVVTPSYEEQLENVLNTTGKLVRTVGTETKKNTSKGEPYIPHMRFAFGGDLQTHGSDFSDGLITIGAGGTHEENIYDGVQLGKDHNSVPNLVEENEVVYNDYVFSNRIPIDQPTKDKFHIGKKREMTYADLAKKLEKEIAERPNDPISEAGFKAQMQTLQEEQERQKQEMEAERARAAYEALPPEEQVAVMSRAAQEEQMAQQAAQQQGMMQPNPEEAAMAQEQMIPETENAVAPQMQAMGGPINKFDKGGQAYTKMLNSLGFHTQREFDNWAAKNNIDFGDIWKNNPNILNNDILGALWNNENFVKALQEKNPALAHAFKEFGYNWGALTPESSDLAAIQSINRGNWKGTNGKGWKGSSDLAFLQATQGLTEEEIDNLSTEQLADIMRQTDAYKKTSKWLEDSENALLYMNALLNDPDTPEAAKEYARKFVQDGKWKDGFNYDYATVFGKDGKGVRESSPGTFWHTATQAVRNNKTGNYVINGDGSIEPIVGDIPTDWTSAGNYTWGDEVGDYAFNYYKRPDDRITATVGVGAPTMPTDDGLSDADRKSLEEFANSKEGKEVIAAIKEKQEAEKDDDSGIVPKLKAEWPRYAGLFGPAVGLGLMAAGVGKPDYRRLDAAVEGLGEYVPADWKPIGNYLTYRPMDIWYEQNRMNANARATDRAIMNTSAPVGTKNASLLANAYNNQLASADLYRKALEYNDAKQAQVENFNRGTDMFNAEAYNKNSMFNADAANRHNQYRAGLAMRAAQQRLDSDAGWYNSLYGNIGGLFKGIGDLGRDNMEDNWRKALVVSGALGNFNEDALVAAGIAQTAEDAKNAKRKKNIFGWNVTKAVGGELKKKKKKRGFTY